MTEQLADDDDSEKMIEREAEKKTKTETDGDGGVGENGDQKNSRQQKVARYSNRWLFLQTFSSLFGTRLLIKPIKIEPAFLSLL